MLSRKSVLLIDDERDITRGLAIRLRALGYDVEIANSGREGLDAIIARRPDVVVLDIRMPDTDGLTMLSQLRRRADVGNTPVVVLSASLGVEAGRRALDLGAQFLVEKPYEPATLIAAMESALHTAWSIADETCATGT